MALAVVTSCGDEGDFLPSPSAAPCTAETAKQSSVVLVGRGGFQPDCIKVTAGDEVTFLNISGKLHQLAITASDPADRGLGIMSEHGFYRRAFTTVGSATVRCDVHAKRATVIVVQKP